MGWVRLEDSFFDHPKVVGLSIEAKLLFVAGLTYCVRHSTDGGMKTGAIRATFATVSGEETPRKAARKEAESRRELVDVGLWHEAGHGCPDCGPPPGPDGIVVHDYLRFQPAGAEERKRRDAARERTERWRNKKRDGPGDASPANRDASLAHARGPHPTPIDSYPLPTDTVGAVENAGPGRDRAASKNGLDGLVELVAGACAGRKRATVHREAEIVVDHLTRYVDPRLIEEVVPKARESGANLPRWFLPTVRSRAQAYGITIPPLTDLEHPKENTR